ncbi:hypothetical protein AMCSP20_000882 [Streptococcus pneumoniae 2090008]|nr:hypothetical protein AMCSP20_000882 [Streptococcus pneumoniae 2090008]
MVQKNNLFLRNMSYLPHFILPYFQKSLTDELLKQEYFFLMIE